MTQDKVKKMHSFRLSAETKERIEVIKEALDDSGPHKLSQAEVVEYAIEYLYLKITRKQLL